ncbi:hypothetical protein [Constantimarinum furrinae]|uniref:Uncharacterized protein n=1 Tax=Constantimarinum furrinae TaxID=2562285 RepID=A0A7G8PUR6_9FLAO|nr:hypothetical protein [Constantimarinum furrinae]QNJ98082.1 hypothetical protein ALE3EI_1524 [Constantimarinum furrinae]
MKVNKSTGLQFLLIFLFSMLFLSCQKEEEIFIDDNEEETITANSTLTNLLIRTSQNSGVIDNIIDGNSCSTLVYPVTVFANGQEVVLQSVEDLQIVQNIFNQFPNDPDTLEIVFPIMLMLEDFSQVTINDQAELDALIEACENGGGNSAIACLDIIYPVTFFIYDDNQQQIGTQTVNNDLELFIFLSTLENGEFISIDFPVSVVLEDGSIVLVNSNQELEQLITECVNNSGGTPDPINEEQFELDLTTDVWYITYFFDDFDETSNYSGYEFSFETNNTAQANNGSNTVNGTWNFSGGAMPRLDLFFGTTIPFDELDEDWEILEATSEIIRLRHNSGGTGGIDLLTFERSPNSGTNNTINQFIEDLTTGEWYVNLLLKSGDDDTCEFADYVFTYFVNGTATAVSPSNTRNGFWTVESNNGVLSLILNFDNSGSGSFSDLNDDWEVLEFDLDHIDLRDTGSGGGNPDLLNFGRNPATGCGGGGGGTNPDPQELRDFMQDGTWFVELFLDNGDDETAEFNGYDFNFLSNQSVSAFNGSQTVNGIWIITVIGQDLNFEFDMDSPLNGADDDEYKVLQYTETSVTLVTLDSSNNIEDTLKFKKN